MVYTCKRTNNKITVLNRVNRRNQVFSAVLLTWCKEIWFKYFELAHQHFRCLDNTFCSTVDEHYELSAYHPLQGLHMLANVLILCPQSVSVFKVSYQFNYTFCEPYLFISFHKCYKFSTYVFLACQVIFAVILQSFMDNTNTVYRNFLNNVLLYLYPKFYSKQCIIYVLLVKRDSLSIHDKKYFKKLFTQFRISLCSDENVTYKFALITVIVSYNTCVYCCCFGRLIYLVYKCLQNELHETV